MRGLSAKGRAGLRIVSAVLGLGILSGRMTPAEGAEPVTDHQVITLWPGGAPGAKGNDPEQDIPTLTVWLAKPEAATGAAVVVCPGGGYGMLASDHEGRQVAEWLNSLGVSAFVLKYRLGPRYHHPAMAPGRRTGDPDGAGSRPEMGRRPADRHSRIFRGRASGLDGRHSFRCRQAGRRGSGGTRQLPTRPFGIGPNPAFQEWPKLCAIWLKGQGFLDRAGGRASQAAP